MPNRVRLAVGADLEAIERFLADNRVGTSCPSTWDPTVDLTAISVAPSGGIRGLLAARPAMLVHELQLAEGSSDEATRLMDFGLGFLRGQRHHQCILNVRQDNLRIQGFLRTYGANIFHPGNKFYTLDI